MFTSRKLWNMLRSQNTILKILSRWRTLDRLAKINLKGRDGDFLLDPMPPYICQFADRDRVSEFLDDPAALSSDEEFERLGFSKLEEYAFWAPRLCALVCVKMCLDVYHRTYGESVASLMQRGIDLGGYEENDSSGRFVDKGWYYAPLISLAADFDVQGHVLPKLSVDDIAKAIVFGDTVIASVHPGIIREDIDDLPVGHSSGGHLVVIVGVRLNSGDVAGFHIHNPSGRKRSTQEAFFVPLQRFKSAFAGRGMLFERPVV
jgi:hypothetical protein